MLTPSATSSGSFRRTTVERAAVAAREVPRRDLVDDGVVDPRRMVGFDHERRDGAVGANRHERAGGPLTAVGRADGPRDGVLARRGVVGDGRRGGRVGLDGEAERRRVVRALGPREREPAAGWVLEDVTSELNRTAHRCRPELCLGSRREAEGPAERVAADLAAGARGAGDDRRQRRREAKRDGERACLSREQDRRAVDAERARRGAGEGPADDLLLRPDGRIFLIERNRLRSNGLKKRQPREERRCGGKRADHRRPSAGDVARREASTYKIGPAAAGHKKRFQMPQPVALFLLVAVAMASCSAPHPAAPTADVPFEAHDLYPEGVAYDASTGTFLVSSLTQGTVSRVAADGTVRPFAAAGTLVSTQGIAIDEARGLVFVAGGDLGVGDRSSPETQQRQAGLAVVRLGTGALVRTVPLEDLAPAARHHANDVALGPDGTAYVTDSFAGAVYAVRPGGEASVLVQDTTQFASENVGLNGIAVHPDGFLLVAHSEGGALYRIGLRSPHRIERVALPDALVGADGLMLADDTTLAVIQNEGADRTVVLRSADGWHTAREAGSVASPLPFPTTAARAGSAVFVLCAKLDEVFDPDAPHSPGFLLQRLVLP